MKITKEELHAKLFDAHISGQSFAGSRASSAMSKSGAVNYARGVIYPEPTIKDKIMKIITDMGVSGLYHREVEVEQIKFNTTRADDTRSYWFVKIPLPTCNHQWSVHSYNIAIDFVGVVRDSYICHYKNAQFDHEYFLYVKVNTDSLP